MMLGLAGVFPYPAQSLISRHWLSDASKSVMMLPIRLVLVGQSTWEGNVSTLLTAAR